MDLICKVHSLSYTEDFKTKKVRSQYTKESIVP